MSIETIQSGIAAIGDEMKPSLTKTFSTPPGKLDTAELPALYAFTGSAAYDWSVDGTDECQETRTYRVQVAVLTREEANPEAREKRCRPLLNLARDTFAKHRKLGNVRGVKRSIVDSDSGIVILPEYEGRFIGFEIRLKVSEGVTRSAAPGE